MMSLLLLQTASESSLWTIRPASPLVENKLIASCGAADAVVTGVHTGLTVWRAVLTQLSGRVRKGAGGTLIDARTVLVQQVSWDLETENEHRVVEGCPILTGIKVYCTVETRGTVQCLWAKTRLTGCIACMTFTVFCWHEEK